MISRNVLRRTARLVTAYLVLIPLGALIQVYNALITLVVLPVMGMNPTRPATVHLAAVREWFPAARAWAKSGYPCQDNLDPRLDD